VRAKAIVEAVQPLGIAVRAGVHTGEVELVDAKVGGIAVAIGARLAALAAPGAPGRWRLYRLLADS